MSTERKIGLCPVPEAAEFLSLSRGTVYARIASGEIPSRRFGRSVRVPWQWLLAQAACDINGQDASEVSR